jgi:hypothetical protein
VGWRNRRSYPRTRGRMNSPPRSRRIQISYNAPRRISLPYVLYAWMSRDSKPCSSVGVKWRRSASAVRLMIRARWMMVWITGRPPDFRNRVGESEPTFAGQISWPCKGGGLAMCFCGVFTQSCLLLCYQQCNCLIVERYGCSVYNGVVRQDISCDGWLVVTEDCSEELGAGGKGYCRVKLFEQLEDPSDDFGRE